MIKKLQAIRTDFVGTWAMAATALCAGLLINPFRAEPLPQTYQNPEERVMQDAERLAANPAPSEAPRNSSAHPLLPESLSLAQMREFVTKGNGVILDARPELFHRLGHIPGALSLPRETFEDSFRELRETHLDELSLPIVVYCSGQTCGDASTVRRALERLGYDNVSVFTGGWNAWQQVAAAGD